MPASRQHLAGRPSDDLASRLAWSADRFGDRTFIIDPATPSGSSSAITYGELCRRADATASLLASLGVRPGDGVHLALRNGWELVACLFGAARIGAFVVPTNPDSTLDDVAYIVSHAECRVSIASGEAAELVAAARELTPEVEHVVATGGAQAPEAIDFATALDERAASPPPPFVHRDLAAVLYTSGTTGWPKGVMLTHRNLLFAGDTVSQLLRIRTDDRWLVSLPMSHLNALAYSTMSTLCSGASLAISDRFVPETWAATASRSSATIASLFSVHVRQLLASSVDEEPPNRLRLLMFAMHLSPGERAELTRRFCHDAIQVYGLTETISPNVADPVYGPRDRDSLGSPTTWSHVEIVDDSGRVVPDDTPGELVVVGEPGRSLTPGYFRREDATADVLRGGRFHTGDRMRRALTGELHFLGRNADVVKPGPENVSVVEIERVLLEHISIVDAAAVGRRDDVGNERIAAYVVLRATDDVTEEELRVWAASRLAPHKVPHRIVTIDELPRTPVGKVRKAALPDVWAGPATRWERVTSDDES